MGSAMLWLPLAALGASLLTFISGFGLGTLLLPVFTLFFPLPIAVLLTAVVHLLNNGLKLGLLWPHVDRQVVLQFGLPAIGGALLGAWALDAVGRMAPLYAGVRVGVDPLRIALAVLMTAFALAEMLPSLARISFDQRHRSIGGLVSGFFGGFSGHQGALRSMFLLRAGLGKEAYIATGVAIACVVDLTRIPLYLASPVRTAVLDRWPLLLATTVAAFAGAWIGRRLMPKLTLRSVQLLAAALMLCVAGMLVCGVA